MDYTAWPSFAAVLDRLCTMPRSATGRPYSNVELGQAIGVTHSYVAQLRKGLREPTLATVLAVAEALDVHPAFFVGGRRDRTADLPGRPFAVKLNRLFTLVHPPGQGEMTPEAVAAAVRRRAEESGDTGWTIAPNTIRDLRSGKNSNPKLKHVVALAMAFGAEPAYFFDEELAAQVEEQLETHRVMDSLGVNEVILRATATSPSSEVRTKALLALVRALRPEVEHEEVRRLLERPDHEPPVLDDAGPEVIDDEAAD
ncbi:transcriptional regulator with XRE-family HTH domain [Saccharothrix ecbatanensis]|uniref:Transcriptional regulator with XRE-family HTH domain n=1 Tax=Saccharothrix ecbatanensis TaxID=1105145 RepID=A0A7W9HUP6_9PSEU|nr:helix-turn-helix transcriptional regulator [Saccharothrix ecbatanensis]MBB5808834.1 transcriptional regulator with XRE-family HTH domain [Saccharothrix ecbatanensis]